MRFLKKNPILLLVISIVIFSYSSLLSAPVTFRPTEFLRFWSYGNIIIKHTILDFHQLGLWDMTSGGGFPLAPYLTSLFYPPTLFGFLLPDLLSIRILVLFHLVIASIAMFCLLRTLRVSNIGSAIGGIVFVVNPYVQGSIQLGYVSEIYNLSLMCFAFTFLWKGLFENKKIYTVIAGIFLGMHILAMVIYSLYFTSILLGLLFIFHFLYQIVVKKNLFKVVGYTFIHLLLVGSVCFGIASVKLLPVIEFTFISMRATLPIYEQGMHLGTIDSLKSYLGFFISPRTLVIDMQLFVNAFFMILIFLSFLRKSKEVLFFSVLLIISFWAWMGSNAPIDIYRLFYTFFPGMNTIQAPHRFIILTNFAIPILAAFGLDTLNKHFSRYSKKAVAVGIFVIFLFIALYSSRSVKNLLNEQFVKEHIESQKIETNNKQNINKYLGEKLAGNEYKAVSLYDIPDKQVYPLTAFYYGFNLINPPHPDFMPTYLYFPYTIDKPDAEFTRKKYILLRSMNAGFIAAEKGKDDHPNPYIDKMYQVDDGTIYKIKNPLSYIHSSPKSILLVDKDNFRDFNAFKAKVLLLTLKLDPKEVTIFTTTKKLLDLDTAYLSNFSLVIVTEEFNKSLQNDGVQTIKVKFLENNYHDIKSRSASIMSSKPAIFISEKDRQYIISNLKQAKNKGSDANVVKKTVTPEAIDLYVEVRGQRSYLSVADTYYPGWIVTIDGHHKEVLMSNGLTKGILIEGKGIHHVIFKFRPKSFYLGLFITTITILILGVIGSKNRKTKKLFIKMFPHSF